MAHGPFVLDDSFGRLDLDRIHGWLTNAYWSQGITRAEVERGFGGSTLVAGAYRDGVQVGCMRAVSDRTRFAYLMDVFVDPAVRGQGLGQALVRFALEHPELRLVYQWLLGTVDAHAVYERVGFAALSNPERLMALRRSRPWIAA
jgi:GNAT superfamily N-acetyltransferase